jgi:hypothetical protein
VVADCLDGQRPDCLDAGDAWVGITTFVAMPADTRCWLQRPRTAEQPYRYQGEERSKRVVVAPAQDACTVATLATQVPAARWYRRTVSEGTKGPMA